MNNKKIPKLFNWLLRHTITVGACVLIIALGIVFFVQANPGITTIGENISTTGLTTSGNATIGGTLGVTGSSSFSSDVSITNASTTPLIITQSGTGSIVNFVGDSITTGTGIPISIDGLTSGTGLDITSTSTAGAGSGISKLFNISRSGTNANASHTAYGLYSSVANTGTTSTNVAGYFSASGATNNYGLIVENGNVGIGTAGPQRKLEIQGDLIGASPKAGYLSTDNILLSSLEGGAYFGRVGVKENQWGLANYASAWTQKTSDATRNWRSVAMSSDGKIQTAVVENGYIYGSAADSYMMDGNVGIGTNAPQSTLQVNGYIQMNTNNGAPAAGDCDADAERGRMILDYTNNRLYICNGATRAWDYIALTD